MTGTNLNTEKHCIALGGLDGARFAENLGVLKSDLGRLETFVADLSEAVDVAPRPIVFLGYEVDRDALLVDHLDESVANAISKLIDMLAMTRTARAALQRAGLTRA
jgi:hypothetical protein